MKMICTKEIALKAVLHGACKIPKVGRPIQRFSRSELIWVEESFYKNPTGKIPLWCMADGSGDGSGYGSGYGCGDGYGCG